MNLSKDEYLTTEQLKELEPALRACEERNPKKQFRTSTYVVRNKPVNVVTSENRVFKTFRPLKRNPRASYFPIMEKRNFIPNNDD